MAGWDGYAADMCQRGCAQAAIYGQDGAYWGQKNLAQIQPAEVVNIINGIKAGSMPSGAMIGGIKHIMISVAEGESITLKKKKDGDGDTELMLYYCAFTKTAMLIGGGLGPAERAVKGAVEHIKEYLMNNNM